MRINEVERLVDIPKKNIRFYEQEGLLRPRRDRENGYRNYEEDDVTQLKRIRVLRRLGLPLEEIRKLSIGEITLMDAMERQQIILKRQSKSLSVSMTVCKELEDVSYGELRPDDVLAEIEFLEQKGGCYMKPRETGSKKKLIAPAVAAAVMILLMGALIALFLWAQTADPIPLPIIIIFLLIPAAVCVGVLLALRSRIQEIQNNEWKDADRY